MARKITLPYGYTTEKKFDLEEGYLVQLEGKGPRMMVMANVTQEQMVRVTKEFLGLFKGPLEWIVETWSEKDNREMEYRKVDEAQSFLKGFGEENLDFFLQDGLTQFGCIDKATKDELFWGKLGILYIYTSDIKAFKKSFKALAIPQKSQLNTLWSEVKNGNLQVEQRSLKKKGKKVQDLIEEFGFVPKSGS